MVDITAKINTLRYAKAQAIVRVSSRLTIDAVTNKTVSKGDVFEMGKAAALLAVKHTSDVIPDCHPIPIEYASVKFSIHELEIKIERPDSSFDAIQLRARKGAEDIFRRKAVIVRVSR